MLNPMDLTGKTVLVTGASSGIGREVSVVISQLGGRVALVARRANELAETVGMMEGDGHRSYPWDLSETDRITELVAQCSADFEGFNGLVHCAGVAPMRLLKQFRADRFLEVMSLNVCSVIEIVRCMMKMDSLRGDGSIVVMSSVASIQGSAGKMAYCASKSALDSSVRCMAKELAGRRVRVNSIQPGWVDTPMHERYMKNHRDSDHAKEWSSPQYLAVTKPIEVANLAAFLLSDATSTITGTSIRIDGGRVS